MPNAIVRRNTGVSLLLAPVMLIAAAALLPVTVVHTSPASPAAATTGQWATLMRQMPINPVHIVLLNTGKVLIVSGSGNVAANTDFESALWDPAHPEDPIPTRPLSWDMFCNGIAVLPDGRPIINGGTLAYDPFKGQQRSALYDPATDTFTDAPTMAHGRWYPTVTALGDGRVMTFSGLDENNVTNSTVEIFDPAGGWSAASPAGWTPPLYPRLHLLPSGKVFYSGSGTQSRTFNPATQSWSAVLASTNYSGTRTYGTSVLLPLTPANAYKPQVMIMGGGNPATATTEIIDLSQSTPAWQWGPSMSQARIEMNATILPTGTVLATGGSVNDEDASTASRNADLYDPISGSFSSAGANAFPRLYHSNALLLPDATVLLVGGNPSRSSYEHNIEIYSPAYLFNADSTPATRPTIDDVSSSTLTYGGGLTIQTANAANISSVVLMRPGAPTHAFDMEQRMVGLSFTAGTGVLNVTGPPTVSVAPPGYYMLFLVNSAGVPSVARFIRVAVNQPPTAAITSPSTNVTVQAGNSVSFAGSGSDSDGTIAKYSWTFPGGNPATSSLAVPGSVIYATPGTYSASLTVTDDSGSTSAPVVRTITVPDFSLSATPTSQTIAVGGSATFSVGVTPGTGFAGSVAFSIAGLPAGATASFSPTAVLTSGSTSLTVTSSASTPSGNYVLAVTGSTGSISHKVNITLAITSDFSLAVTPSNVTVAAGKNATYTVTVAPGFTGTVTLSVRGLPRTTTAKFSPASIVNSGTSTLTVSPKKNAPSGTSTLTITGTSGTTSHNVTATLVIQ
jgi:PKD repeat protein